MRKTLATVGICLLTLALAAGQQADTAKSQSKAKGGTEDQIKQVEQDWARETVTGGGAVVDKYEADDIVSTDPGGRVTSKAQDKQDLVSGDLKFQSMELSDVKVQSYGNVAVATGTNNLKGTYKGKDISGAYRFTDTWVKRNGKWQCVATQGTKVMQQQ